MVKISLYVEHNELYAPQNISENSVIQTSNVIENKFKRQSYFLSIHLIKVLKIHWIQTKI